MHVANVASLLILHLTLKNISQDLFVLCILKPHTHVINQTALYKQMHKKKK